MASVGTIGRGFGQCPRLSWVLVLATVGSSVYRVCASYGSKVGLFVTHNAWGPRLMGLRWLVC